MQHLPTSVAWTARTVAFSAPATTVEWSWFGFRGLDVFIICTWCIGANEAFAFRACSSSCFNRLLHCRKWFLSSRSHLNEIKSCSISSVCIWSKNASFLIVVCTEWGFGSCQASRPAAPKRVYIYIVSSMMMTITTAAAVPVTMTNYFDDVQYEWR